jgi:hypothetical protein
MISPLENLPVGISRMTRRRVTLNTINSLLREFVTQTNFPSGVNLMRAGPLPLFRKGLSNTVGGRINDRNPVALVIANPNFSAVWRDINANGLPTQ